MIIHKTYTATCRACKATIILREYEGLEDATYSDHHCKAMTRWLRIHPRARSVVSNVKETS